MKGENGGLGSTQLQPRLFAGNKVREDATKPLTSMDSKKYSPLGIQQGGKSQVNPMIHFSLHHQSGQYSQPLSKATQAKLTGSTDNLNFSQKVVKERLNSKENERFRHPSRERSVQDIIENRENSSGKKTNPTGKTVYFQSSKTIEAVHTKSDFHRKLLSSQEEDSRNRKSRIRGKYINLGLKGAIPSSVNTSALLNDKIRRRINRGTMLRETGGGNKVSSHSNIYQNPLKTSPSKISNYLKPVEGSKTAKRSDTLVKADLQKSHRTLDGQVRESKEYSHYFKVDWDDKPNELKDVKEKASHQLVRKLMSSKESLKDSKQLEKPKPISINAFTSNCSKELNQPSSDISELKARANRETQNHSEMNTSKDNLLSNREKNVRSSADFRAEFNLNPRSYKTSESNISVKEILKKSLNNKYLNAVELLNSRLNNKNSQVLSGSSKVFKLTELSREKNLEQVSSVVQKATETIQQIKEKNERLKDINREDSKDSNQRFINKYSYERMPPASQAPSKTPHLNSSKEFNPLQSSKYLQSKQSKLSKAAKLSRPHRYNSYLPNHVVLPQPTTLKPPFDSKNPKNPHQNPPLTNLTRYPKESDTPLVRKLKLAKIIDSVHPLDVSYKKTEFEIVKILKDFNYEEELVLEVVNKLVQFKCFYERGKIGKVDDKIREKFKRQEASSKGKKVLDEYPVNINNEVERKQSENDIRPHSKNLEDEFQSHQYKTNYLNLAQNPVLKLNTQQVKPQDEPIQSNRQGTTANLLTLFDDVSHPHQRSKSNPKDTRSKSRGLNSKFASNIYQTSNYDREYFQGASKSAFLHKSQDGAYKTQPSGESSLFCEGDSLIIEPTKPSPHLF